MVGLALPYYAVRAFSMSFATRQRLSFDNGRDSTISTLSPMCTSFCSLCALYFTRLVMYFLYATDRTRWVTRTTTVFCILSEVTVPTNVRRCEPRPSVLSVSAAILFLRFL